MEKDCDNIVMLENYGPLKQDRVYRVIERAKYFLRIAHQGKSLIVFPNLTRRHYGEEERRSVPEYQLPTYEDVVREDFGSYYDKDRG